MDRNEQQAEIVTSAAEPLPGYLQGYAEELDRWHVEVLLARTRRASGRPAPTYDQPSTSIA